jgi:hypothetical protein
MGLYIGKYPLPGGGGNISGCHLGGKNMKRRREKGRKCKKKKEERGKKKEERGKKIRKGEVKG